MGLATTASAQQLCSKTNNKGKIKYKTRDVCKTKEVDEGQVALLADIPPPPAVGNTSSVVSTTNTSAQTGTIPSLLNLDGDTTFEFTTAAASTDAVITFSAECAVSSAQVEAWVGLDLIVSSSPSMCLLIREYACCGRGRYCATEICSLRSSLGPLTGPPRLRYLRELS